MARLKLVKIEYSQVFPSFDKGVIICCKVCSNNFFLSKEKRGLYWIKNWEYPKTCKSCKESWCKICKNYTCPGQDIENYIAHREKERSKLQ